jgi:DNA-binding MarR family transcriptional regulator
VTDEDEPRWLDDRQQRAWLTFAAMMVKLPAALDAQLQRDSGLSHFEYLVLAGLSEQPDRTLQMSEIARFSSSSLSRLSHVAARLEAKGWLTRARVPGPGRRTDATLTEAGYAKVVEAAPGHVAAVRDLVVDVLSERELAALGRIAAGILTAIDPGTDWLREPPLLGR